MGAPGRTARFALKLGGVFLAAFRACLSHRASSKAAGSLAVLLIWVYSSAQILFLGAEFTREYALTFGSLRRPPDQAG